MPVLKLSTITVYIMCFKWLIFNVPTYVCGINFGSVVVTNVFRYMNKEPKDMLFY